MIDQHYGIYSLTCDICGEEADIDFADFYDAVEYKKTNGWKSKKSQGQ